MFILSLANYDSVVGVHKFLWRRYVIMTSFFSSSQCIMLFKALTPLVMVRPALSALLENTPLQDPTLAPIVCMAKLHLKALGPAVTGDLTLPWAILRVSIVQLVVIPLRMHPIAATVQKGSILMAAVLSAAVIVQQILTPAMLVCVQLIVFLSLLKIPLRCHILLFVSFRSCWCFCVLPTRLQCDQKQLHGMCDRILCRNKRCLVQVLSLR